MADNELMNVFDNHNIRSLWNDEQEQWYFSIIGVVAVLTDSVNATTYWRKLKQRFNKEGNQSVTNCHALEMKAKDGKMRKTDCATTELLFLLIQSIPSPKTEPFKMWMAEVASERIDQILCPELSIEQAMKDH